jgi:hypothetical protein
MLSGGPALASGNQPLPRPLDRQVAPAPRYLIDRAEAELDRAPTAMPAEPDTPRDVLRRSEGQGSSWREEERTNSIPFRSSPSPTLTRGGAYLPPPQA